MADNSGSTTMLGLIVGGLVVFLILVFAWGWSPSTTKTVDVKVESPKITAPDTPKTPSPSK